MRYFTVQGRTDREALDKMKASYGEDARILTHRAVRRGGILGLFGSEGVEVTGYISEDGSRRRKAEVEEEKKKILDSVRREQTLQVLLKEIQGLREAVNAPRPEPREEVHPSVARIEELLAMNDFTEEYRAGVRDRIRREFSLASLEDYGALQGAVVEWIGDSIAVDPPLAFTEKGTKVVAIVGPTGVGKTTTIAKLAAVHGLAGRAPGRRVRIVTIDNYRIAARQQIETYAEIMRIPVTLVESAADLSKSLALAADADLVLIDTIGRSPRDLAKLAEMKEILAACGTRAVVYLALSATTKASDAEETLRQFEPFGYRSVILTKLDETMRIGNVVSVLARHRKSVAYLCDGQGVPQDLSEATAVRLLMNMEGFRINRERLEKRYGRAAAGAPPRDARAAGAPVRIARPEGAPGGNARPEGAPDGAVARPGGGT
jgi:flagellar biosynthesis protein FlhF